MNEAADLIERIRSSQSFAATWANDDKATQCTESESLLKEEQARGAQHDPEVVQEMTALLISVCFRNIINFLFL